MITPVKIRLTFVTGADDEIEALRDRDRVGWRAENTCLEEAAVACFEAVEQFGFGGFECVVKLAED